ncbi:MAG: arginine--tRNA ligase [Spirochaetaceae bacterium]|nr:MAG: arginine--tRNA ligase [Spirochaetaceae bacterium]
MSEIRQHLKQQIVEQLRAMAVDAGADPAAITDEMVQLEVPPRPEMGDLAAPLFPLARVMRQPPAAIAAAVSERLEPLLRGASCEHAGAYINIRLDRVAVAAEVITRIARQGEKYGRTDDLAGTRVMVEFSCPNTNKPLHLGHLRNDILGESVARILSANGADVRKVNLINDRGIHICKSMLAYQQFGNGATPDSEGVKPDHFVGTYYVRFNRWAAENADAEKRARDMLQQWENGEPGVLELWKLMNGWAVDGIWQTYRRTGVSFDQVYFESQTYEAGRDEVLRGLQQGVFYREQDGSIWVDLESIGLDRKVLLRGDGTSLYLTQDIGTAIARHRDWPFDRLIYVVASEQRYHFTVLFHVLKQLGMQWADNLFHLAYGMVNLPEGKMKSREGTVVDADDLIARLEEMAAQEIRAKGREDEVGDVAATAADVALGALHYYLLQVTPGKDMVFDPGESISFNGNTGPYLQYSGARISSMLRKAASEAAQAQPDAAIDATLLAAPEEWELVKRLGEFPHIVSLAGRQYSPSIVTSYLYDVTKTFSRYYHDYPIAIEKDPPTRAARLALARSVAQTLRNGCALIGIPFLEVM